VLGFVLPLAHALPGHAQQLPVDPVMASTRPLYDQVKGYITRAADQMPEEHYPYRPTPEVRTFGELIAHIATTQYFFCAAALGEANPEPRDFEKGPTTRRVLTEGLQGSFKYCDRAYALSDAQVTKWQPIKGFGERAPLSILILNIGHNNEHYGNIVTYMRMKGLVPPSSQPRK
jgi:uncharacterized damage-inducible protein DinB